MQLEDTKQYRKRTVFSCIITSIFSVLFFILLGSFYKAVEHSTLLNLVVWTFLILLAYSISFLIFVIIYKFKNIKFPNFYNGIAIASGFLIIFVLCLCDKDPTANYLFVNSFTGIVAGALTIIEFLIRKRKTKE